MGEVITLKDILLVVGAGGASIAALVTGLFALRQARTVSRLQEQAAIRIEEVRHTAARELKGLDLRLSAESFAFSLQHKKEFEVYETLWKALVKLLDEASAVEQQFDGLASEEPAEIPETYRNALSEVLKAIHDNEPFYHADVYAEVVKFRDSSLNRVMNLVYPALAGLGSGKFPSERKSKSHGERLLEGKATLDGLRRDLDRIRDAIRVRIRLS